MTWYVVRTKACRERQAKASLVQRGVEVYLPILRRRVPRRDRRDWEPLFPGYLFASLEVPSDTWLAARSAPDVAYFLGQDGYPSAIDDDFIAALKVRMERAGAGGGASAFSPGEHVRITQGPFQELEAVFERSLSAVGRSRVLVQILHRLIPVDLPEGHLRKVG